MAIFLSDVESPLVNLSDEIDYSERIAEAQRRFQVGTVIECFDTWAVTDYGMECLTTYYAIKKARLFDGEPDHGWVRHMAEKYWVHISDFWDCLSAARSYHYPKGQPKKAKPKRYTRHVSWREQVSPKLRFAILKRDGYRCLLCGVTADAGATLHVDHKVPVAKGGQMDESNLWTLCANCNLGKGASDL